jgi:hypothetical protein
VRLMRIALRHMDGMPDGDPGEFNDKLSQLLGFLAEQFQFIGWCGTRPGRSTILRPSGRKLGVGHFGSPRESLETKFGSKWAIRWAQMRQLSYFATWAACASIRRHIGQCCLFITCVAVLHRCGIFYVLLAL